MRNEQKPIAISGKEHDLKVFEIFSTIQGEGPFAGRRATFIRLYGCNLQCPLCDTDYTSKRTQMTEIDILVAVKQYPNELIVITGGEPYRQDIYSLVEVLQLADYTVQIETNGTYNRPMPSGTTIVCSPKEDYLGVGMPGRVTHYKYVIHHRAVHKADGLPTLALAHKTSKGGILARPPLGFPSERIYVQPVDTGDSAIDEKNLQAAIVSCRQFGYTLCLQVHKIINLP